MNTKRSSNYEIIRIVAMILIVIHHIFCHCIDKIIEEEKVFRDFSVHKSLILVDYAGAFGRIGTSLFVLISGYFLINKKIDISKSIVKVIAQMIFASIVLTIASFIHLQFDNINASVTLTTFNTEWWFAGYYIAIIFLAWIGLNKNIKDISKEKYMAILLILFAVISINWIINIIAKIGIDMLTVGIFTYLLGGYIRLYEPLKKIKTTYIISTLAFVFIFMAVSFYTYMSTSVNEAIEKNDKEYIKLVKGYECRYFAVIIISVLIFEWVRRWKIKNSTLINYIGASTFMIYLIHDNEYSRKLFYKISWVTYFKKAQYGKLFAMITAVVIIVFLIGITIYSLYNRIFKSFFSNLFSRKYHINIMICPKYIDKRFRITSSLKGDDSDEDKI